MKNEKSEERRFFGWGARQPASYYESSTGMVGWMDGKERDPTGNGSIRRRRKNSSERISLAVFKRKTIVSFS